MTENPHSHRLPLPAGPGDGARDRSAQKGFWTSKAGLVAIGFLLIAAFFLLSEHRAHALGVFPYLLILACPLMHLFMHGGHGGRGDHGAHGSGSRQTPTKGFF